MIRLYLSKKAQFLASTLLKKVKYTSNISYKSSVSKSKNHAASPRDPKISKEVFFPSRKLHQIKDKIALITGGADEIGLRCVNELLKRGAKGVMIADSNKTKGSQTVMELAKKYGTDKIAFIQINFANYDMLRNAFSSTINFYKSLDIVVNNVRFIDKSWQDQVDENIKGVVLSTQLSLEFMGRNKGGNGGILVNITSDSQENSESLPLFMAAEDFIIRFDRTMASTHFDTSHVKVLTICKATFDNVGYDLTTVLTRGTNGCIWMP